MPGKMVFRLKLDSDRYMACTCILLYGQTQDNEMELQGAVSIRKTALPGMAIPMLKIRRPNGHLIFNIEIAIRR